MYITFHPTNVYKKTLLKLTSFNLNKTLQPDHYWLYHGYICELKI